MKPNFKILITQFALLSLLLLPIWAQATTTSTTPVDVGFTGQRFSASSTNNVVMHVTITADATGGTLNSFYMYNDLYPLVAEEGAGLDIVPGSTKLWYVNPDSGGFSTSTAQLVGTFTYYSPSFWELTSLNYVVTDGSGLYVTIDITATPRENAICAFTVLAHELEFDNFAYTGPPVDSPSSPPLIYLTSFTEPTQVQVGAANLGSPSISTGQTISIMEFTLDNIGAGLTGPVYLSGLTLTVRDQSGSLIPPNTAFQSIGLRDGVTDGLLSFVGSPPGSATGVYFPLAISVTASTNRLLKVFGTVTSNTATAAAQFQVRWDAPASADARYLYTMNPVPVAPQAGQSFPLSSFLYSVQQAASLLQVYHTPVLATNSVVLKGNTDVNPFNFTFINPGNSATSRVDVTHLTLTVTDSAGTTITPSTVFSRLAISGGVLYGENISIPTSGSQVTVTLSNSYISVPSYQPVTATVLADILPDASAVDFRLVLSGSAGVVAQDANTLQGVPVTAAFVSDPFPMTSPALRIASSFFVSGQSAAPTTVYPNQQANLLSLTFTHPGPADIGNLVLLGLTLTAQNLAQAGLNLADSCSAVQLTNGNGVQYAQAVPPATGASVFLPVTGVQVSPLGSFDLVVAVVMTGSPQAQTLNLGLLANMDVEVSQPSDPTRPVFVSGAWPILSQTVSVGGGEGRLRLSNYPNPFAAGRELTQIAFFLESSSTVSAVLYTLAGDQVESLMSGTFCVAGEQVLSWNGRTATGTAVKNGVYLLRIEAVPVAGGDTIVQLRKIAVVK